MRPDHPGARASSPPFDPAKNERAGSPLSGVAALFVLALGGTLGAAALAQTPAPPAGDPAAGENLFLDRCTICHTGEAGAQGPSLKGVYGRRAASIPGFAYSAALKGSGVTWTAPELDRFLTNPSTAIPGTAMPITVPDARQRADLIAYLAAQH
jgi:cytochrome c